MSAPSYRDSYWSQYPGFVPNPNASVAKEFKRLMAFNGWSPKDPEHAQRKAECFEAEFEHHYGTGTHKLQTWQDLCREVGIEPIPPSITQCKKVYF